MNDLQLIRQYEPILHCHAEENFYPMGVDGYLQHCSLHAVEGEQGVMRVPPPYVDRDDLPGFPEGHHFLVYADRRETDEAVAAQLRAMIERKRTTKGVDFRAFKHKLQEKLEEMGINLLNLFRPFGMSAQILAQARANYGGLEQEPPRYHYRVSREGGYTVLHYWFFYAYNDFLSAHRGSNDHEGDWEHVQVILQGERPVYALYASHGGGGAQNRRPWAQVETVDDHPVVYVAAGSHASYFTPALKAVERKGFTPGRRLGPTTKFPWQEPQSLDVAWCHDYRGRWGALQWGRPIYQLGDAQGGPPTGPKYERDGRLRQAWADPLAYAGLK